MSTTHGRSIRRALCVLALAVPLLAGCAGAEGEAKPSEPSTGSQSASEDPAADLEASAPDGKYAASYVLTSSNIPGAKDGSKSTSTYAFTFDECTDTECTGTVKAPAKGSWTWDGTDLVATFDELDQKHTCTDDNGDKVKDATFMGTTEHGARLTGAVEGDEPPAKLEGSFQQETHFTDFRNGCRPEKPGNQWAKFSLMLERK